MIKLIVLGVALFGAVALVNAYAPQSWKSGINLGGAYLPWAIIILGGFLFLAAGLKSK